MTEIHERVPAPRPGSSFNQETKLERFYKPEKMRTALFKMEQFYLIWQDERTDDKHKKAAKALFEHFVSWESIARECLNRMSEDEVKEMALDMEWTEECEFDDDMSDL